MNFPLTGSTLIETVNTKTSLNAPKDLFSEAGSAKEHVVSLRSLPLFFDSSPKPKKSGQGGISDGCVN
jgi:hypothetical protein